MHTPAAAMANMKDKLLPPADRAQLETMYGQSIGPWLDAKLEAKAQEMLARFRDAWAQTWKDWAGENAMERAELLISREEVAEMLDVSLSTVKRMEVSGELPKPRKVGKSGKIVRHRLVDIEELANVRGPALVPRYPD